VLPLNQCFVMTNTTRDAFSSVGPSITTVVFPACPALGTRVMQCRGYTTLDCSGTPAQLFNISLGVCDTTGNFMTECMTAQ
jgi:hypothetical protein